MGKEQLPGQQSWHLCCHLAKQPGHWMSLSQVHVLFRQLGFQLGSVVAPSLLRHNSAMLATPIPKDV